MSSLLAREKNFPSKLNILGRYYSLDFAHISILSMLIVRFLKNIKAISQENSNKLLKVVPAASGLHRTPVSVFGLALASPILCQTKHQIVRPLAKR